MEQNVTDPPGYTRLKDVSRFAPVSEAFLRKQWAAGRGPRYSRIGRCTLIKITDLEAWIARHAREPESAA
jgi:hypothetical protein